YKQLGEVDDILARESIDYIEDSMHTIHKIKKNNSNDIYASKYFDMSKINLKTIPLDADNFVAIRDQPMFGKHYHTNSNLTIVATMLERYLEVRGTILPVQWKAVYNSIRDKFKQTYMDESRIKKIDNQYPRLHCPWELPPSVDFKYVSNLSFLFIVK
ncbi:2045_t:CDS:2, partial [Scutellospora calospora]